MPGAPFLLVVELPDSLAGSLAFIMFALSVTYAALRLLLRVEPVQRRRPGYGDGHESLPPDESGDEYGSTAEPDRVEVEVPDASPVQSAATVSAASAVSVEAITVHGVHVSVGDSASHVMQCVRRRESAAMPVIEKDDAGRATRVTRKYKISEQAIRFVFERDSPGSPLLLTDLHLQSS